jgi:hypothetical protein
MTETQAKSGAAGAPTTQAEAESADGAGPAAAGRAVVGRATVPGEAPSPKFSRAPGMAPPPETPAETGQEQATPAAAPAPPAVPAAATRPEPPTVAAPAAPAGRVKPVSGGPVGGQSLAGAPSAAAGAARPGQSPTSGASSRTATLGAATAVGAARVSEAVRAARSTVSGAAARGPRRARLNLKRIDPWSVMKFSFAVSIVLFIVVIVATAVLYLALDAMGVFESINSTLTDLISAGGGSSDTTGFKITAKGVIGTAALIGLVNVVLVTALATLAAFIYNVCADLVGGIEVTLAERD